MLNRLFATALLVAVMMIAMLPNAVSAALPPPPGSAPKPCFKLGQLYPHGAIFYVGGFADEGFVPAYRCEDGNWVFLRIELPQS